MPTKKQKRNYANAKIRERKRTTRTKTLQTVIYRSDRKFTCATGVIRGRDKIQDKYKKDVYIIIDRPFHAVYTVKQLDSDGPLKNVNRSEIKAVHCDKRDGSPESDESDEPEVPLALRRKKRTTAGYHSNYLNQPRSVNK